MPDGTVVKVNRTILSDTSEDGNSYFFHSTSFHNVEQADDKTDAIDEVTEESEDKFEEFPDEVGGLLKHQKIISR